MNIDRDILGKLGQIASLAVQSEMVDEALAIFEGIKAELPDNVHALSGWAIAMVSARQYEQAIDVLRLSVLPADPGNGIARCFLGLALQKNGQVQEGERILEECLQDADDVCRAMAEEALALERA